jgi:hypothetical protein
VLVDGHAQLQDPAGLLEPGQGGDGLRHGVRGGHQDLRQLARLGGGLADVVHRDALAGGLDVVQHVVKPADERVDLLPIERRDPGLVQRQHRVVRDLVAAVLQGLDLTGDATGLAELIQHLAEQARGGCGALGMGGEGVPEQRVLC